VEDFLQRTADDGILHYTIELDPEHTQDIDAWGNEWEADHDEFYYKL
jgi:hypothetical protein